MQIWARDGGLDLSKRDEPVDVGLEYGSLAPGPERLIDVRVDTAWRHVADEVPRRTQRTDKQPREDTRARAFLRGLISGRGRQDGDAVGELARGWRARCTARDAGIAAVQDDHL